jgi:hypothetical protein
LGNTLKLFSGRLRIAAFTKFASILAINSREEIEGTAQTGEAWHDKPGFPFFLDIAASSGSEANVLGLWRSSSQKSENPRFTT